MAAGEINTAQIAAGISETSQRNFMQSMQMGMGAMELVMQSRARANQMVTGMIQSTINLRGQDLDHDINVQRLGLQAKELDVRAQQVSAGISAEDRRLDLMEEKNRLDAKNDSARTDAYARNIEINSRKADAELEALEHGKKNKPYVDSLTKRATQAQTAGRLRLQDVGSRATALQREYDSLTTSGKLTRGKQLLSKLSELDKERRTYETDIIRADSMMAEANRVAAGGAPNLPTQRNDSDNNFISGNPLLPSIDSGGNFVDPQPGAMNEANAFRESLGITNPPPPQRRGPDESTQVAPRQRGSLRTAVDEFGASSPEGTFYHTQEGNLTQSQIDRINSVDSGYTMPEIVEGAILPVETDYIPRDIALGTIFDTETPMTDVMEIIANTDPETRSFITGGLRNQFETDFLQFIGHDKNYDPSAKTENSEYANKIISDYARTGVPEAVARSKMNSLQREAESQLNAIRLEETAANAAADASSMKSEAEIRQTVEARYSNWIVNRGKQNEESENSKRINAKKRGINLNGELSKEVADAASVDSAIDLSRLDTEIDRIGSAGKIAEYESERRKLFEDREEFRKNYIINVDGELRLKQSFATFLIDRAGKLYDSGALVDYTKFERNRFGMLGSNEIKSGRREAIKNAIRAASENNKVAFELYMKVKDL